LYVTQSSRKKPRRRTSSRRRRRRLMLAGIALLVMTVAGVVFREEVQYRFTRVIHAETPHPPTTNH
jgi:multisubunit Na+/H+ antiporter MnhB subunit